jgi:hypothetical protein
MGNLLITTGVSTVGIQHLITAGQQFTGVIPPITPTPPTFANNLTKFAIASTGGLFNFENSETVIVTQYAFNFNAATAYELALVNLDNTGAVIAAETQIIYSDTATTLFTQPQRIILGARQALRLVTTNAVAAMCAQVYAVQERGFRG